MKTFKCVLIIVVFGAIGGYFLFGDSMISVGETVLHRTRTNMTKELGEGFRLDQAEMELSKADGAIHEQRRRVAELRVGSTEYNDEISSLSSRLDRMKVAFKSLDEAWERSGSGLRPVSVRGKLTQPVEIQSELERVAATIQKDMATLENRKQVQQARGEALRQATSHLTEIQRRRERVQLALDTSRVDLECVRLLQEAVGTDVNASELASAEGIVRQVSRELKVQRETANLGITSDVLQDLLQQQPNEAVDQVRAMLDSTVSVAGR